MKVVLNSTHAFETSELSEPTPPEPPQEFKPYKDLIGSKQISKLDDEDFDKELTKLEFMSELEEQKEDAINTDDLEGIFDEDELDLSNVLSEEENRKSHNKIIKDST